MTKFLDRTVYHWTNANEYAHLSKDELDELSSTHHILVTALERKGRVLHIAYELKPNFVSEGIWREPQ